MSPVVIARQIFFKLRKDYQASFKSFRKIEHRGKGEIVTGKTKKQTEVALPLKG